MEITMNLEDVETLHPILKQFPVVQSAALLVDFKSHSAKNVPDQRDARLSDSEATTGPQQCA